MSDDAKEWAWFDGAFGQGEAKKILKSSQPAIQACWEQILLLSFYARHWVGHKAGMRRLSPSRKLGGTSGRYRSMFTGNEQARLGIELRLHFLMLAQHECRTPSERTALHLIEQLLEEGVGCTEILTRVKEVQPHVASHLESQCAHKRITFSELPVNDRPRYRYRLMLRALCHFIPLCQKMLDVSPQAIFEEVAVSCVRQACRYSLDADTKDSVSLSSAAPVSEEYTPKGNKHGGMTTSSMTVQDVVNRLTLEQKQALLEDIKVTMLNRLNEELSGVYSDIGYTQKNGAHMMSLLSKIWAVSQNSVPNMLMLNVCRDSLETFLARGNATSVLTQLVQVLSEHGYPLIPLDVLPPSTGMDSIESWYESKQVLQLRRHSHRLRRYIIGILLFDIYSGHGELSSVYCPSGLSVANSEDLIERMTETKAMKLTTIVLRHTLYYGLDISLLYGKDKDKGEQQIKTIKELLEIKVTPIDGARINVHKMFEEWAQVDNSISNGLRGGQSQTDTVVKHRFKGLYKEIIDHIEEIQSTVRHQASRANGQSCYLTEGVPLALWSD